MNITHFVQHLYLLANSQLGPLAWWVSSVNVFLSLILLNSEWVKFLKFIFVSSFFFCHWSALFYAFVVFRNIHFVNWVFGARSVHDFLVVFSFLFYLRWNWLTLTARITFLNLKNIIETLNCKIKVEFASNSNLGVKANLAIKLIDYSFADI